MTYSFKINDKNTLYIFRENGVEITVTFQKQEDDTFNISSDAPLFKYEELKLKQILKSINKQ